jgi:BirA family transcriptional regulator, biotin operon repressor / biotin---[acetyl-CoA-carboxylase] ligase
VSSSATHPDCFRLLRLLADARFRSGALLARALGCSRAGLAERVREAQALGLSLLAVPGRGYRLAEPLDLIDRESLGALLAPVPAPFRVEVLDECTSTSTLLLERALNGAPHASVVVCERQTAGRGRRGAQWISTLGGSLTFSLLWRFDRGAGELAGLSLAVAVGIARALEALGAGAVGLKWPNDLLLDERKLGGILIEMNGSPGGPSCAVIGVGLNVRLPEAARRQIPLPVAELAAKGVPPSRTVLLARVLQHMAAVLAQFEGHGFGSLRDEWLARHAWQGRRVMLRVAERKIAEGLAVGVGEDGALLLASHNGLERFHAGELSLRPA